MITVRGRTERHSKGSLNLRPSLSTYHTFLSPPAAAPRQRDRGGHPALQRAAHRRPALQPASSVQPATGGFRVPRSDDRCPGQKISSCMGALARNRRAHTYIPPTPLRPAPADRTRTERPGGGYRSRSRRARAQRRAGELRSNSRAERRPACQSDASGCLTSARTP